ncbi:MAG TPA: lysylphosphatidylglycerol synthase transmembrane domain-containing protein [Thermoanaerobaculia bacterium]|nr:lysylphosphatidylglycerol synthase transmembrane domain-containing protein [Thermoanaerobaculia bacterium]
MTPDPPKSSALKTWGIRLLKTGITVLALWLTWRLVSDIQWSDLTGRLSHADWWFLIPGLLLLVGRYYLWDWRFRLASQAAVQRSPRAGLGFTVLMASAALNLITPSARLIGGLMRARYFARYLSRPFGLIYGVVLYDQVAHHVVMTTCTWIAVIVAAPLFGHAWLGMAAAAVLVAVVAVIVVWTRRSSNLMENPLVRFLARGAAKAEGRMQRLYSHGHEAVEVFVRLLGHGRLHGRAGVLGLGFFVLNLLSQWLVFRALGIEVPVLVIFAGVALGNAAGMLTGTPGGLGTTEAAMVGSFVAMGMIREDALAGTLLYRGLHYASILGIGLPALLFLELKLGGRKEVTS